MPGVELVLILLAAVAALAAIAERTSVPYPIFLVLGGLALALIPNAPTIELDPDIVFLLLLPPILCSAAYFMSWRNFRANLHPIGLMANRCVLFTTLAVAIAAHAVIAGFTWPAAFGGTDGHPGIGGSKDPTADLLSTESVSVAFTPALSGLLRVRPMLAAQGTVSAAAGSVLAVQLPSKYGRSHGAFPSGRRGRNH